jgi:hypothetical protein
VEAFEEGREPCGLTAGDFFNVLQTPPPKAASVQILI